MKQITFHLDFVSPYALAGASSNCPQCVRRASATTCSTAAVLLGALPQRHANPDTAGIAGQRRMDLPPCEPAGPGATGVGLTAGPPSVQPAAAAAARRWNAATTARSTALSRHGACATPAGGADALDPRGSTHCAPR